MVATTRRFVRPSTRRARAPISSWSSFRSLQRQSAALDSTVTSTTSSSCPMHDSSSRRVSLVTSPSRINNGGNGNGGRSNTREKRNRRADHTPKRMARTPNPFDSGGFPCAPSSDNDSNTVALVVEEPLDNHLNCPSGDVKLVSGDSFVTPNQTACAVETSNHADTILVSILPSLKNDYKSILIGPQTDDMKTVAKFLARHKAMMALHAAEHADGKVSGRKRKRRSSRSDESEDLTKDAVDLYVSCIEEFAASQIDQMPFKHVPSNDIPKNIGKTHSINAHATLPRRMSGRLIRKGKRRNSANDGVRNTRTSIAAGMTNNYESKAMKRRVSDIAIHRKGATPNTSNLISSEPSSTDQAAVSALDEIQKNIFRQFIHHASSLNDTCTKVKGRNLKPQQLDLREILLNWINSIPEKSTTKSICLYSTFPQSIFKGIADVKKRLMRGICSGSGKVKNGIDVSRSEKTLPYNKCDIVEPITFFAALTIYGLQSIYPLLLEDDNKRMCDIAVQWSFAQMKLPFAVSLHSTPAQYKEFAAAISSIHVAMERCFSSENVKESLFKVDSKVDKSKLKASKRKPQKYPLRRLAIYLSKRVKRAIDQFELYLHEKQISRSQDYQLRQMRFFRERTIRSASCIICFECKPDILSLCCGRPTHLNCLAKWLKDNESCAFCRAPIPQLDVKTCATDDEDDEDDDDDEEEDDDESDDSSNTFSSFGGGASIHSISSGDSQFDYDDVSVDDTDDEASTTSSFSRDIYVRTLRGRRIRG